MILGICKQKIKKKTVDYIKLLELKKIKIEMYKYENLKKEWREMKKGTSLIL